MTPRVLFLALWASVAVLSVVGTAWYGRKLDSERKGALSASVIAVAPGTLLLLEIAGRALVGSRAPFLEHHLFWPMIIGALFGIPAFVASLVLIGPCSGPHGFRLLRALHVLGWVLSLVAAVSEIVHI
jgi:asparagine N-glycosylation enzyme membrane subunit Stt3